MHVDSTAVMCFPVQKDMLLVLKMSCGMGHRHGLDMVLLWLWYRSAAQQKTKQQQQQHSRTFRRYNQ